MDRLPVRATNTRQPPDGRMVFVSFPVQPVVPILALLWCLENGLFRHVGTIGQFSANHPRPTVLVSYKQHPNYPTRPELGRMPPDSPFSSGPQIHPRQVLHHFQLFQMGLPWGP